MSYIEVAPAYGRDYTSQAQVKADWNADKDFRLTTTGQYINKSDAKLAGLKVLVRYARLTKIVEVK